MVLSRVFPAPLERIGALMERQISDAPDWTLGPVEREQGRLQAQAHGGLGRAPSQLNFSLTPEPGGHTRLEAEVSARSRWTSASRCRRRIETLLNAVAAAVESEAP